MIQEYLWSSDQNYWSNPAELFFGWQNASLSVIGLELPDSSGAEKGVALFSHPCGTFFTGVALFSHPCGTFSGGSGNDLTQSRISSSKNSVMKEKTSRNPIINASRGGWSLRDADRAISDERRSPGKERR
jgi:hypothetical protein